MAKKQTTPAKPAKPAKPDNAVGAGRATRKALKPQNYTLTPDKRALVLALLREGATPLEIIRHKGIPTLASMWRTRDADEAFRKEFDEAVANGARSMLAEAQELARDAATSDNPDDVRVADMYMRVTQSYVEKLAPRQFGQLVKVAGDADQAAITVNIVKFSDTAPPTDKD